MDIKAIVLFAAIALIVLVLLFATHVPTIPASSGAYIEIVSSKAGDSAYSLEYIITSEGLMFKKEGTYPTEPKIGVSATTPQMADDLFSNWPSGMKSYDAIACRNCDVYHLF